ncbi:MAG: thioredoxin family protein [Desulfobacula sp.]|uniref:thioredoxin family protein n=1 Tax=Desulfobacula sp. TaxID=2593537 RepID=UPI0025BC86C6|nr:thioredoxin family protein [Desulfobacula sp.]MCD4720907.1 thioredoxin family protein [Desulfobacula sp.]
MPIFNPQAAALIQNWDQSIENQVKIKRLTTDHAEEKQFINFTDQVSSVALKLIIESEKGEKKLPGFLLKENVTYSALPLEKELEPFLEALSQINGSQAMLSEPIRQALDKIDIPVQLKLYIALQCPHCPNVVRTVIPLAFYCKNIYLHIIDGSLFPETAQKDKVMSAPCLMLDDDFRWTGSVNAEEIIKMITSRDPAQLSAKTLKTILEEGDASWIARQMIEKGDIFDAFIKLLLHETWSVRLGAMVIVEELVETDPKLAARLCPLLIDLFDEKDIPVQGDILYAMGEAGDLETKKWIQTKLPKLEHPDLIDAATEALDSLDSVNN